MAGAMRYLYGTCWLLAALGAGCGTVPASTFSNSVVGTNGQVILFDDLKEIAADPNLPDDEARKQAFRDLGIEDEKLIEALLAL